MGEYTVWINNDIVPYASVQYFDANGKMLDSAPKPTPIPKDGIVNENGTLYYYVNDVKQLDLGMIEIEVLGEKKYIYIRSGGELAVGEYYVYNGNGIVPDLTTQNFDENGYFMGEVRKNGDVNGDNTVDEADYTYIADVYTGKVKVDNKVEICDVNGDGKFDIRDIIAINEFINS